MLPLIFLGIAVVTATNQNNNVNTQRSNDSCKYTLVVPSGQCSGSDSKKVTDQITSLQLMSNGFHQQFRLQQVLNTNLERKIASLTQKTLQQADRIEVLENTLRQNGIQYRKHLDCAELRLAGQKTDSVYNITLEHALSPISVWCDMSTGHGGWTVIQRRQDGSVYFYRDWDDYKKGFGMADGEYWLGNDNIFHLTNQKKYLLRIDLWDFDGNHFVAEYDDFYIENELHKYKLHVGSYNGTAGDAMTYHNNRVFSTKYRDATNSCAFSYKGGFWYNGCAYANLNGNYHHDSRYVGNDAVFWYQLNNKHKALKKVEMKVRPMTFHKK